VISVILALVVVAALSLGLSLSHDSACSPAPPLPAGVQSMKAIVSRCYGPPDVLRLEDVAKPPVAADRVLVKVEAASVNPLDWHYMRGQPYVMRLDAGLGRPKTELLGVDFAGTVESVGRNVTRFKPGDHVFGGKRGAFAQYVSVAEDGALAQKPANATFEQAAAVPIAAVTALQALRDKGALRPGQKVLVNGASGGVGSFAVQIGRALGAEVTGVCSTRNVDLVRSLGATHVIDYTREDFTAGAERYDVVLDNVGNRSLLDIRRVMKPDGAYVVVGGPSDDRWLGPVSTMLRAYIVSPFISQKVVFFLADLNAKDLAALGELMRDGKVTPVIDRRYGLDEVPIALRYVEEGHARGKVVVDVASHGPT
jgi:NADPH:quinone reductase-like Zn-dependent oxidoreductase